VSLLLEAPASAGAEAGITPRRSLLPWIALLCVVAGAAASLVLSAPRLASLGQIRPSAVGAPFVTVPEYGPRGSYVLGYEHGATVRLSLTVANDGRLPVTVTSVDLGGGPAPLLAVRGVEGLPLSLSPGESGSVTASVAMVNCRFFNERQMQTYDVASVGFSSLGQGGTRLVRFDRQLLVKSPTVIGCPDRLLDRSANRPGGLL